jgi:hypothetical protein
MCSEIFAEMSPLLTISMGSRIASRESVYSPNTSRFVKFPQRPITCPSTNPGTQMSASFKKLSFLILVYTNIVRNAAMTPP